MKCQRDRQLAFGGSQTDRQPDKSKRQANWEADGRTEGRLFRWMFEFVFGFVGILIENIVIYLLKTVSYIDVFKFIASV